MTYDDYEATLNQYMPPGFLKGSSLILPPDVAIDLVNEMRSKQVATSGASRWRYVSNMDREWRNLMEDQIDFDVKSAILDSTDSINKSAEVTIAFIQNECPAERFLVSVDFDLSPDWVLTFMKRKRGK